MKKMIINLVVLTLGFTFLIWTLDWFIKMDVDGLSFNSFGIWLIPIASLLIGLFAIIYGFVNALKESKKE